MGEGGGAIRGDDSTIVQRSMLPTKICPQCKAAVPVRRKTCEHCDHTLAEPAYNLHHHYITIFSCVTIFKLT